MRRPLRATLLLAATLLCVAVAPLACDDAGGGDIDPGGDGETAADSLGSGDTSSADASAGATRSDTDAVDPDSDADASTAADAVDADVVEPPLPPAYPCDIGAASRVIDADPTDYRPKLAALVAGDRLRLAAGTYDTGLPIHDLLGTEQACIVVEGPEDLGATFLGSSTRNTVSIRDSAYVVVRNLHLDGLSDVGDGVKAEGNAAFAHHITIENLFIENHDASRSIVGISTKCPAWGWVIRGNRIERTGTGLYLGNSDGSAEFVDGLIENNVVVDPLGYAMQIKHQNGRSRPEMPADADNVVRHNVFAKIAPGDTTAPRPNLLVGHPPLAGPGSNSRTLVYANFFYQNPLEMLLQGEGNLFVYANVMVNRDGGAVNIRPHNDIPRDVFVFANTILARDTGIRLTGADPAAIQHVAGNLVFAATPVAADSGGATNLTDTLAAAGAILTAPDGSLGVDLDLSPAFVDDVSGAWERAASEGESLPDGDRDFEGRTAPEAVFGAFGGDATRALALDFLRPRVR